MKSIFKWFIDRLCERSTWFGLLSLITAIGGSIHPDYSEIIISFGMGIAGLVAILLKDNQILDYSDLYENKALKDLEKDLNCGI